MEYRRPRVAAHRLMHGDHPARESPWAERAPRARSFAVFFLALLRFPALADRLLETRPLGLLGVFVLLAGIPVFAARPPGFVAAVARLRRGSRTARARGPEGLRARGSAGAFGLPIEFAAIAALSGLRCCSRVARARGLAGAFRAPFGLWPVGCLPFWFPFQFAGGISPFDWRRGSIAAMTIAHRLATAGPTTRRSLAPGIAEAAALASLTATPHLASRADGLLRIETRIPDH